jgi:hypothetical protein
MSLFVGVSFPGRSLLYYYLSIVHHRIMAEPCRHPTVGAICIKTQGEEGSTFVNLFCDCLFIAFWRDKGGVLGFR